MPSCFIFNTAELKILKEKHEISFFSINNKNQLKQIHTIKYKYRE